MKGPEVPGAPRAKRGATSLAAAGLSRRGEGAARTCLCGRGRYGDRHCEVHGRRDARAIGGVFAQLLSVFTTALAPSPDVAFVLQLGAVGGAIGTAVAARARQRDAAVDVSRITAAWTLLGLAAGLAAVAVTLAARLLD